MAVRFFVSQLVKGVLTFALKNRYFVFFVTLLIAVAGYISFKNIAIDAFPDVTNTSVTIITQWPGRSAEEVEKCVAEELRVRVRPTELVCNRTDEVIFGFSIQIPRQFFHDLG